MVDVAAECYVDRTIYIDAEHDGAFEAFIDAMYILTTEPSARIERCIARLRERPPLSKAHIRYNKTFKGCSKPNVSSAPEDILHAHRDCLRDAVRRGCERFLVVEDDCEFLPERMHMVAPFIEAAPVDADAFMLGCIPCLSRRLGSYLRIHRAGGMHAVVWTARGAARFLALDQRGEVDTLACTHLIVYAPLVPIAVQPHPDTENSKEWMSSPFIYVLHRWVFRSHREPRMIYEWGHRLGHFGGTEAVAVVVVAILIALVTALLLRQLPFHEGRETSRKEKSVGKT